MPIGTRPLVDEGSTFEELIEMLMAEPVTGASEPARDGEQLELFGPVEKEERKERE
jgi:hypothetical protein